MIENGNRELYIGLDPGFGNFKVATIGGGVTVVPSVVGVGETDLGLLSLGAVGKRSRRSMPDRVTFGGVTYLVGEGVARYAEPVQRMDFHRLSDGPELLALFYATMARALDGRVGAVVRAMVGLPVEVMADKALGRGTLRGLRGWMVGPHEFEVNGESVRFAVEDVRAMAQPAGAFFAWGLNDAGKWVRPTGDLKAPVAICDIGFNTLDLFAVQGGDVVGRFTGGDTAGMRRAVELLMQSVGGRYGVDLSLHEADALLRQRRPRLYTCDGEMDVLPLVRQALGTAAAGIVSFVERRWGKGRQFAHLLFAGGGAEAMRVMLLRQYPHGVVLPNAVGANAMGLACYAVRIFGG